MASRYIPEMMDRKIVIQRATVSRDAHGGEVLTWADYKTRWAEVQYAGGAEGQAANKETASLTVVFRFRHISDLTEKDRISYDGKYMDIVGIIPEGRKHFQTVQTEFRR
ncbi:MAG TPA: phage head closure protein [Bacteroidales bacterium]|nr:phage head closure protein [Bacteroidales bacterium]